MKFTGTVPIMAVRVMENLEDCTLSKYNDTQYLTMFDELEYLVITADR